MKESNSSAEFYIEPEVGPGIYSGVPRVLMSYAEALLLLIYTHTHIPSTPLKKGQYLGFLVRLTSSNIKQQAPLGRTEPTDAPSTESKNRHVYNLPIFSCRGSLDQGKHSLWQSTFEAEQLPLDSENLSLLFHPSSLGMKRRGAEFMAPYSKITRFLIVIG